MLYRFAGLRSKQAGTRLIHKRNYIRLKAMTSVMESPMEKEIEREMDTEFTSGLKVWGLFRQIMKRTH